MLYRYFMTIPREWIIAHNEGRNCTNYVHFFKVQWHTAFWRLKASPKKALGCASSLCATLNANEGERSRAARWWRV